MREKLTEADMAQMRRQYRDFVESINRATDREINEALDRPFSTPSEDEMPGSVKPVGGE